MPMYDNKFLLDEALDGMAAASTNSSLDINFGVTNPNCAVKGEFGAHIVITQAYTAVNSGCNIIVKHGAATAPTTTLIARLLTQTQLKVLGAHYFIPFPPANLQFVRLQYYPVSETSTLGYHTAWLGPRVGKEI